MPIPAYEQAIKASHIFNTLQARGVISVAERQASEYNFEVANTDRLFQGFREAVEECELCISRQLPIPAYEQAIKASHIFNTLQARGVISVAERQAYIGRVRDLAKAACGSWLERTA